MLKNIVLISDFRFFIYGSRFNNLQLVADSLFFVAVFILESLEGILMAKLLIALRLMASFKPLSFLLLVVERAIKSLIMPEKTATKNQQNARINIRPRLIKFY